MPIGQIHFLVNDYLISFTITIYYKVPVHIANSEDPDQKLHSVASDLGLPGTLISKIPLMGH